MKTIVPILLAVFFIPFFLWLFYMIRKESKNITVKTYQQLENEVFTELKCPRCGKKMKSGYTLASRGLIFRNAEDSFSLRVPGKFIPNTANLGFSRKENLSWRCENCNLLLVDYGFQLSK